MMARILYGLVAFAMVIAGLAQSPALAEAGDWLIRLRGIAVVPDEEADITVINGDAHVDNAYVPELDFTYFFTDNIAAELILATSNHDAMAIGTDLGDVDLGDVQALPPTLLLQFHPIPEGQVSPYIGVGVNWTIFFDADAPGGTVTDISYDNSVGIALQAGTDIQLGNDWFLNLDIKKIFMGSDVSINGGAILADVDIDPWVFGVGFGRRF